MKLGDLRIQRDEGRNWMVSYSIWETVKIQSKNDSTKTSLRWEFVCECGQGPFGLSMANRIVSALRRDK